MDSFVDLRPLSAIEIYYRSITLADLWYFLMIRYYQWLYKSRSRCLKKGDINFGYLYDYVRVRT